MFESDDYDQILSQFDFPDVNSVPSQAQKFLQIQETCAKETVRDDRTSKSIEQNDTETANSCQALNKNALLCSNNKSPKNNVQNLQKENPSEILNIGSRTCNTISPKHTKRKIIDSHFDPKIKRKFPGPAGLLTGNLQESNDESICHMELLSQDIDYSENNLRKGSFELPLWHRLLEDVTKWNMHEVDAIREIKMQAVAGNLRRRKAQIVTAFVEAVDRSATDPLIVLRDNTGNIKGTLHRDAWAIFSPYIVSEYCAVILWKPTVLTTGSAFKKHYLNITLTNIYAVYSSAILPEEMEVTLPESYIKEDVDNFTLIRNKESPENLEMNHLSNSEPVNNENNLLDGLDSIFSDDIF